MIIHREIGTSYHHKTVVYGVNYSPLMVESKEEALVKEKRWPEAISAAFPPPIFLRRLAAGPVLCFPCFSAASSRKHPGDPFYSWF
jgi:hypothetical protein